MKTHHSHDFGSVEKKKAFTLIELLVVIAIISLLVSILLPSLQKAKELARMVACQSTLRVQGFCMGLYTDEFDGIVPRCDTGTGLPGTQWFYRLLPYHIDGLSYNSYDQLHDSSGTIWHSCRQDGNVFYDCPSVTSDMGTRGVPGDVWPDYKLNGYYGLPLGWYPGGHDWTNLWQLGQPSDSVLICERDGGNWAVTPDVFPPITWDVNPPAGRHLDNANVLWADLHVEPRNAKELAKDYDLWDWE